MRKKKAIEPTAVLVLAGLSVALVDVVCRIFLKKIIGDQGYAYYNYAWQTCFFLMLFSVRGISEAVSELMSERLADRQYKNAHRIFVGSGMYVLFVSVIAAACAYLFSRQLLPKGGEGAIPAFRILLPAIFLTGILGVMQGYFRAYRNMMPTVISKVVEAAVGAAVTLGVGMAMSSCADGVDSVSKASCKAAGSAFGPMTGAMSGILVMMLVFSINRRKIHKHIINDKHHAEGVESVKRSILQQIKPLAFSMGFFGAGIYIDQMLFASIMAEKGIDGGTVAKMFSRFSGMYLSVLLVPFTLACVSSAMLASHVRKCFVSRKFRDLKQKIHDGIRNTMLFVIPISALLSAFAFPLMRIFFGKHTEMAGWMLVFGSCAVIFYSLSAITGRVLLEIGQSAVLSKNELTALLVNVVLTIVLTSAIPLDGFSVMIANLAAGIFLSMLNQKTLRKCIRYQPEYQMTYIYPGLAAFGMAASAMALYGIMEYLFENSVVSLLVAISAAIVLYFIYYVLLTHIKEEELRKMYMGNTLVRMMKLLKIY